MAADKVDPIHQFQIVDLFPVTKIGHTEIAFTNSAAYMVAAVTVTVDQVFAVPLTLPVVVAHVVLSVSFLRVRSIALSAVLVVNVRIPRVRLPVEVGAVQGHIAGNTRGARLALVVNDSHPMARVGLAHAAGLGGPANAAVAAVVHGAIADDVVDFGLTEHFIDHHPQLVTAIGEHSIAHGLASAHDGLQVNAVTFARTGVGFHHGLERRGKQEAVSHTMLLHQRERQLGAEAPCPGHDGATEIQRGQQGIHEPARPGPVGRRPENRLRARVFSGLHQVSL